MFARKLLTGVVAGSVAASVIGLTAGSASAVYAPDPDDVVPVAGALLGVGSDTSQVVIKDAANAYNATNPAVKIGTYAATGGGTIVPPGGAEITRPNGSGAGKTTLYNPSNVGVNFARSSSAQSSAETTAGLQSIPFALDRLATVTATSSNAPASLTIAQLVDIYKGNTTNWNQIGGTAGTIKPLIPQAGSGTRTFFEAQLTTANGGAAVALGAGVGTFQENDDTSIKSDPNAVAPFSAGRAELLGTLRVEGGFLANRALYNVVRGANLGDAGVQAFFGDTGFLCSAQATRVIEDAGFRQLARAGAGGVCGQQTQVATTNFVLNELQTTATTLSGTSAAPGVARLVAGVSAGSSPQGTMSFFEGTTSLAANVPLVSGQATVNLSTSPGSHTYTARFVPAGGSVFRRSNATTTVIVSAAKAVATVAESFPSKATVVTKVVKGKKKLIVKPVKGSITISSAAAAKASGAVTVKLGKKTVGKGTLSNGVAKFKIKGLKPGKNKLTLTYGGDGAVAATTLKFTVKAAKPTK